MKITREVMRRINLAFIIIALCMVVAYASLSFFTPEFVPSPPQATKKSEKIPDQKTQQSFVEAVHSPFFHLKELALDIRIPDLRSQLIYYGSNCRPDADPNSGFVRLGFRGQNKSFTSPPNEKIFLKFHVQNNAGRWSVADISDNSPLWIEVTPQGREAQIKVFLKSPSGEVIHAPADIVSFKLALSPLPQNEQSQLVFEIGPYRIDNTLFQKMGAIWYGQDALYKVLEEDPEKMDKELIFFGPEGEGYVLWTSVGDCFIFDNGRFTPIQPGPDSLNKPLLMFARKEDNQLHFNLWDSSGQTQIDIGIGKSHAPPINPNFPIKLLGARSRTRLIAELQGKRTLISSDEWILQTKDGILPILNHEQLDLYVSGALRGTLLALDGIKKVRNEQCLTGILIDPSRSIWQEFSLPLYRSAQKDDQKNIGKPNQLIEEDDDDDEDLDDSDDDSEDDVDTEDLE